MGNCHHPRRLINRRPKKVSISFFSFATVQTDMKRLLAFSSIENMGLVFVGLGLTLIHLISIPITNTSVNPARSTGQALFVGDWALGQLWLFWLAPIAGAVVAGLIHKALLADDTK